MDQGVFNWLVLIGTGLGGAVLKTTWDATVALRKDLASLQAAIAETYVRRDDFRAHAERIESGLTRIEAKLDRKVDK